MKDLLSTTERFDLETDDVEVDRTPTVGNVDPTPASNEVTPASEIPPEQQTVEKHYVTRSGCVSKPLVRYTS